MPRKYGKKTTTVATVPEEAAIVIVDFSTASHRGMLELLYEAAKEQADLMGDSEDFVKLKFAQLLTGNTQHGMIAEIVSAEVRSHCLFRTEDSSIFIEQFCGTKEFIATVVASFERELKPSRIIYSVNEENVDFFIDELNFVVRRVILEKVPDEG